MPNKIKKIILPIIFSLILLFAFQANVFAAGSFWDSQVGLGSGSGSGSGTQVKNVLPGGGNTNPDPRIIIAQVINIVLGFLGIIFLCLTVYAGYLYMTANGEEKKTQDALGTIRTAIIGLIIVLAAYGIANLVIGQVYNAANGTAK
jgi:hypothetical protein